MFNDYATKMVPLDAIHWGQRHRRYDESKARELAESIERVGLINPITVARAEDGWQLVAGLHRVHAFRMLGREQIPAHEVDADDLLRELIELDENLMHSGLTVLEQAEQLSRKREILLALRQINRHGGAREQVADPATCPPLPTFAELVSSQTGLGDRQLRERLQVARDIPDDVKDVIRDTPLADNQTQLTELAKLKDSPAEQRAVAEIIADDYAEGRPLGISVGMAHSMLTAPDGPVLRDVGKQALIESIRDASGLQILFRLIANIQTTGRWEMSALLRGASAEQERRLLNDLPGCIDWLQEVKAAVQRARDPRNLMVVQ